LPVLARVSGGDAMGQVLTTEVLRDALRLLTAQAERCADELSALDGALGDGDLGVTLVRGLRTVAEQAESLPPDLGAAFLQCAKAFVSISGSTYGTLLATGVMSVAKALRGRTEVGWQEAPGLLAAALETMRTRGKAEFGDKTVLDAVAVTAETLRQAEGPEAMLPAAQRAVTEAIDQFRDRPARQGRARMFGERSVGRDDPGMVAWLRLLEGLSIDPQN
jgi:phosphoenolpyruvate---glycerone phosphotransferase subunit DhaL